MVRILDWIFHVVLVLQLQLSGQCVVSVYSVCTQSVPSVVEDVTSVSPVQGDELGDNIRFP